MAIRIKRAKPDKVAPAKAAKAEAPAVETTDETEVEATPVVAPIAESVDSEWL